MRTLTSNAQSKAGTRLATEPISILQIDWSDATEYYGDKSFTLTETVQGKLLTLSAIQATGKQDTGGEISSANVLLDDTDGTLKTRVNRYILEGTVASVYHHYEGNAWADKTLMFKGKIAGPIVWSEGERTLAFDIESFIDDAEVGYAPEIGDITDLNPDAAGVMWPIAFGAVKRLKAVPIKQGAYTTVTAGVYGGWSYLDSRPVEVSDGSKFPQDENMYVVIDNSLFYGYFSGNTFYRSQSNILWHSNLAIAARPTYDVDSSNRAVCWVAPGVTIAKMQCWDGTALGFNYCTKQEGTKCYFKNEWPRLLDAGDAFRDGDVFTEVSGCVHHEWYIGSWSFLNYWYLKPSSQVYQYNKSYSDLYVINQYPSLSVAEVMAYRTYDGEKILVPVPSSYYTVHLNYSIGGQNATVIEFATPLVSRISEQWESDIYVSFRSSLASNASDILKWLIETYTSYGVDTTAFATVKTQVASFPANFALLTPRNVLDLLEDIAWQARCAIFSHNGVISVKYLSWDMPIDYGLTKNDVLLKTLELSFVPTEDLVTKLIGTWKTDYTGEKLSDKTVTYRNNVDLFGLVESTRDVYIYSHEELVKMTIYFWGYRYSNSWRTAKYPTVLRTLALELFDCIGHTLQVLSTYTIRGIVEDISHDSVQHEISIQTMLASKAGDHTAGEPIEDPYFWIGDPAYPVTARVITDPLNGLVVVDYVPPVVNETTTNSNTQDETESTFFYKFIQPTAEEQERGVAFTTTVQLQNASGLRVYNTVDAVLSITSGDGSDVIDVTDITLTNGQWSGNVTISGGTTSQTGVYLSLTDDLARSNFTTGNSDTFSLIDEKTGTLTWTTNPSATVSRGVPFTIAFGGGNNLEVIDLVLSGADASDVLKDASGTPLSSVVLDGSGNYSGSVIIEGGAGAETGCVITLVDSRYATYADAPSTSFAISAAAFFISLVQSFDVNPTFNTGLNPGDTGGYSGGGVEVNPARFVLSLVSGELDDYFTLRAELLDADDVTIDYTGTFSLIATDATPQLVQFLSPVSGGVMVIDFVSGVSEIPYSLNILPSTAMPILFIAHLVYNGVDLYASLPLNILATQTLLQTVEVSQIVDSNFVELAYQVIAPSSFARGVPFTLSLQATEDGNAFDYIPAGNVSFTLSGDLNGETIDPTLTDATGWSNGFKAVSVTISGGSGAKILTINVED